ncbi:hypothetical protein Taro_020186, partial [Colocasia esculenta]|nr:hypothetical protein [Colocasia esculenta]
MVFTYNFSYDLARSGGGGAAGKQQRRRARGEPTVAVAASPSSCGGGGGLTGRRRRQAGRQQPLRRGAAGAAERKVQKFEEFVDRRLKPDLILAIGQRDKLFQEQKVLYPNNLKKNIENLQKSGATSLRTLVNIGSEVYAQADVPDTRHIFVDVGLGFHVEFTWSEALEFIAVREARITRYVRAYASCFNCPQSEVSAQTWRGTAAVAGVPDGRRGETPCACLVLQRGKGEHAEERAVSQLRLHGGLGKKH